MPSRRDCLAAGVGGLAASLAGCLTRLGLAHTGELQLKAVSVTWTHEGRPYRDEVLWVALDEPTAVDGRVDEPLAELVADPTEIVVSEAVHADLEARFETVEYLLGFCGRGFDPGDPDGCRNTRAIRRGFNRVQFGDRAEVRIVDGGFQIVDVYEGDDRDWRSEVTAFDFDALHAEHGR